MITVDTTIGWDRGRYQVQRRCDHKRGQRSAECVTDGWHTVATSDDVADAMRERARLHDATRVDHRIVDRNTGREA